MKVVVPCYHEQACQQGACRKMRVVGDDLGTRHIKSILIYRIMQLIIVNYPSLWGS